MNKLNFVLHVRISNFQPIVTVPIIPYMFRERRCVYMTSLYVYDVTACM